MLMLLGRTCPGSWLHRGAEDPQPTWVLRELVIWGALLLLLCCLITNSPLSFELDLCWARSIMENGRASHLLTHHFNCLKWACTHCKNQWSSEPNTSFPPCKPGYIASLSEPRHKPQVEHAHRGCGCRPLVRVCSTHKHTCPRHPACTCMGEFEGSGGYAKTPVP